MGVDLKTSFQMLCCLSAQLHNVHVVPVNPNMWFIISVTWEGGVQRMQAPSFCRNSLLLFKRNFVALLINQSSMVYKHSNEHFSASEWWWYLSFLLIDYSCLGNIPWSEVECVTIFLVLLELILSLFFPFSICAFVKVFTKT